MICLRNFFKTKSSRSFSLSVTSTRPLSEESAVPETNRGPRATAQVLISVSGVQRTAPCRGPFARGKHRTRVHDCQPSGPAAPGFPHESRRGAGATGVATAQSGLCRGSGGTPNALGYSVTLPVLLAVFAQYTFLGDLRSYQRTAAGIAARCDPGATLEVSFINAGVVRITLDRPNETQDLLD